MAAVEKGDVPDRIITSSLQPELGEAGLNEENTLQRRHAANMSRCAGSACMGHVASDATVITEW